MELYEDRGRKGQDPTPIKLAETLLALLKQPERTYIMLDALDEPISHAENPAVTSSDTK
jgi:predicted alternative tryptophan synthase beta-subunit